MAQQRLPEVCFNSRWPVCKRWLVVYKRKPWLVQGPCFGFLASQSLHNLIHFFTWLGPSLTVTHHCTTLQSPACQFLCDLSTSTLISRSLACADHFASKPVPKPHMHVFWTSAQILLCLKAFCDTGPTLTWGGANPTQASPELDVACALSRIYPRNYNSLSLSFSPA